MKPEACPQHRRRRRQRTAAAGGIGVLSGPLACVGVGAAFARIYDIPVILWSKDQQLMKQIDMKLCGNDENKILT
jgi:hypothetical protein